MDVALLLLMPTVGGYIFSTKFVHSRYPSLREDGRRIYFRAIFYAVVFFISAFLFRLILIANFEEGYQSFEGFLIAEETNFLFKSGNEDKQVRFILVCLYSLVIGSTLWYPLNIVVTLIEKFIRRILNYLKSESDFKYVIPYFLWNSIKDDDFERLITIAATRPMPLMITMNNNKIYAGYVTNTVDPCVERKAITLLPLVSGYRNSENGKTEITTNYINIYEVMGDGESELGHLEIDDFEIVLPLDKVQSMNMFDFDAYQKFNNNDTAIYIPN